MWKHHGFSVQSFANPLKEDVVAMGFDRKVVFYEKPPWMRALLQVYGQAKRAIDPDYWVKRAETSLDYLNPGNVFIFDVERIDYPIQSDDLSETALDDADFQHVVWGESGELDDLVEHVNDCLWYESQK
jgi:hypothetical protein